MTETTVIADPEHYFEVNITLPNDIRLSATVTVPTRCEWKDIGEVPELVQMTVTRLRSSLLQSMARSDEVPF